MEILKPKHLQSGDRVGIIAPAGPITDEQLGFVIENVTRLGFEPFFTPNILKKSGYFSASDDDKIDDIHNLFADKSVKAIICARGGYGTTRILHRLDYDLIGRNPKPLIGYSDITALLWAIFLQTGIVTFHGPVGNSSFNRFTTNCFREILCEPSDEKYCYPLETSAKSYENTNDEIVVISHGTAEGEMIGGNLSLICALMGTDFELDFSNRIVFIEEIAEPPYKIDRMLTQLIVGRKLDKAKAVLLGVFNGCEAIDFAKSKSLLSVLQERLVALGIPVVYGLPFGHIDKIATFPLGIKTRISTNPLQLSLLESAVD